MTKLKLAIFFNNLRGLEVYKILKKKFDVDVYLSQKNLNRKILKNLNKRVIIKKVNKNIIKKIKKKKYFLLITAGWPIIFSKELYLSSKKGTINLHAGRLPKYRGGSPLNWQIINNEKKIGINVLKMTKKLDSGAIYSSRNFNLKKNDDIKKVHQKVNQLFPKMVLETIIKIEKNIKPRKQKNFSNFPILKQRNDKDGEIIWSKMNALQVFNFVRAITKPYPGAYYYNTGKIKKRIFKCEISRLNPKIIPGSEFTIKKKKFIKCKLNSIKIIK